jgi:hypothetical protein
MAEQGQTSVPPPSTTPSAGSDIKLTLPKIKDKSSWPAARFQIRNWLRMHGLLELIDDTTTTISAKVNGQIFGVIAAQCEGSALTIAQGVQEGDGRALFRNFDTLWRSDKPASLLDCIRTITTSTLTDAAKFETFVAERAAAARRLQDGGMALPESFVALCLLLGLSSCSQLSGLLSIYAMEEANSTTTVTTARVTEAARSMLACGSHGNAGDDLREARRSAQVLAAEVKTLKRELATAATKTTPTTDVNATTQDKQKKDGCYYCKKNGHRAFHCKKLKSDFPSLSQDAKEKWQRYVTVTTVTIVDPTQATKAARGSKVTDLL